MIDENVVGTPIQAYIIPSVDEHQVHCQYKKKNRK